MQHQELNHFIDSSSFDESINLEDLISNKNDNPLTLTKLFALLRTWKKSVHNHFAQLIFLVCKNKWNGTIVLFCF